jgi:hypothetical protein
MITNKKTQWYLGLSLLLLLVCGLTCQSSAFTHGETYDKSNYQAIQDVLAPSILASVKDGEFQIKTSKLESEPRIKPEYQKLTDANEGKYDFNDNGNLIIKETGKPAGFLRADPFAKIDPKDPKVAQKIMEKFYFNIRCRHGSNDSGANTMWVGSGGKEREIVSRGKYFNYTNMPRGPLPNPNNFRSQSMTYVSEPYDLRGTVSMAWEYNGDAETVGFSYLPMLRRVRRTSASARSDPFMGSDACTDDAYGYNGKNADMEFKFIGTKDLLMPFSTDKVISGNFAPDGGFIRTFPERKAGFQIPGWQYSPYAIATLQWILRPLYIVEMNPKDKYYNYGRQILYIDQTEFCIFIKEAYDRAGTYWKKVIIVYSYHLTPDGTDLMMTDAYPTIDDKTKHATVSFVFNPYGNEPMINRPYELCGPETFTTSAILQLSK